MATPIKKQIPIGKKHQIVALSNAPGANIQAIAKEFNIDHNQIRRWKRNVSEMTVENLAVKRKKFTFHSGAERKDPHIYVPLLAWFQEKRELGLTVTVQLLVTQYIHIQVEDEDGFHLPDGEEALAAYRKKIQSRISRWLKSINVVYRRATHVAQNTRFCMTVINSFVHYCNNTIRLYDYGGDDVVNMDETNCYFDQQGRVTLNNRGDSTVNISTTGNSSRCTIMLAVTLSGKKLDPFVIFKGKSDGRLAGQYRRGNDEGLEVAFQDAAWVDAELFTDWINRILKPFVDGKPRGAFLILDKCTAHSTSTCLRAMQLLNTAVIIFLSNCFALDFTNVF